MHRWGRRWSNPDPSILARDHAGNLATATSTSGWALTYPGRVADPAVIGAGNYCGNRYGAATRTDRGELSIRAGAARLVVLALARGASAAEALEAAITDIAELEDRYVSVLNVLALDTAGNHAAVTNGEATYLVMTDDMDNYSERRRRKVTAGRDPGGAGTMERETMRGSMDGQR